jgi:hypothetical protein
LSHEGLEGPFRQKNGQVLYYDPKAGQYYDRDKDMYIDYDEHKGMNEAENDKKAKLKSLMDKLKQAHSKLVSLRGGKSGMVDEAPIDQTVAPAANAQVIQAAQQAKPGQPVQPQQAAVPLTQPKTTAQQPPAPQGQPTAAVPPGQPTPPAAGQAGGAPLAPPAGTPGAPGAPAQAQGNNNAATTPMQNLSQTVTQLAQDPAAAKQAAIKLGNVAK